MALTLNVAPITFDAERLTLGRLPYTTDEAYEILREEHRATHVFRFDQRDRSLVNVPIARGDIPLGRVSTEPVAEHLYLLGKACQQAILRWLSPRFVILHRARPITFWGGNKQSRLLERAITAAGGTARRDLDVLVRYRVDTRALHAAGRAETSQLVLALDVATSNLLEIPVSDLIAAGFPVENWRVCRRAPSSESWYRPHLETIGRVRAVSGECVSLAEATGQTEVPTREVLLEPRQETLESVVQHLYGRRASEILRRLGDLRRPFSQAPTKLDHTRTTLAKMRTEFEIRVAGPLVARLGELLIDSDPRFPPRIETDRPNLLFGAQGTQSGRYPDVGIQRWGPYHYTQHVANEPVIAIVCESRYRGRMEQFAEMLRSGFPKAEWDRAMEGRSQPPTNPFAGGLIQKFRLQRVTFEFEEVRDPTPAAYRGAVVRVLQRLPALPQLALVQTRRSFHDLEGESNPYYVVKAGFMMEGVPVQTIHIENVEANPSQLPYILNNLALASYAKMQGVPWVLATRTPASHELVVGMGYSEVRGERPDERTRYVGLTTLFYGDGRYALWGLTREVAFEDYAAALLESLRTTVRFVRDHYGWQRGDAVRLIFHVYKPLKHVEMNAIRELVGGLLQDEFAVTYAFLDISSHHVFNLFDSEASGARGPRGASKGIGVPSRGVALQLGPRTALLQLTGPGDLKTEGQGAPQPLLIELHEKSDFTDLVYLVRQVYAFSFVSWRSFFPGTEPVTISYSRRIANALGNLSMIEEWDSRAIARGMLRHSQWFL